MALFEGIEGAMADRRCMVVVGLPGTGKSLLVREVARRAARSGRRVHLLQWDVARLAWDTPEVLARFPEIDGVTHAGIRAALGLWVRGRMADWFSSHAGAADLLIVEAPIIGGRFAELAMRMEDVLEPHLAARETLFVVIAPTRELQSELRQRRAGEADSAKNALEKHNATVAVLDMQVATIERVAPLLGLNPPRPGKYDPDLYVTVMQEALKHRNVLVLRPAKIAEAGGSVYEFGPEVSRIEADALEVAATISRIVEWDAEVLRERVDFGWALT